MINMLVNIHIRNGMHVKGLPRSHESLTFEDSAVIPVHNTGAASAFENTCVS